MNKSDDYLWDRSGDVDPEVARLEALLSPLAPRRAAAHASPAQRHGSRRRIAAAAAAAA